MQRSREYTIDDFIVQKKIGEGSFGSVYKAVFKDTNEPVAIKKIKLSSQNRSDVKNVANEVRVLCSIEHPHIVSYKCSFWDKYQSNICIVMEYVGGGDLSAKIASYKRKKSLIPEGTIWTYLIQMLKGLKVLHDLKIIHRDIKAANVFLSQDESEVKLGDMNVSKVVENNFTKTRVGTPLYFSPEIWNGKSYDYKTDVWSLGCLVYELCALTYPFNGHSMNDLRFSANRGRYAPIPTVYSKELNDFIRLCLQVEDYKRPTVDKLLEHPVVKEKLKKNASFGLSDCQFAEAKLIDTIQIPYDFRKMKLPSKKLLPKRSNSSGNIRLSRPSSSNIENKENGNRSNVVVEQVEVKIVKPALNKHLPPQNPSRAALLGLRKPPLVPKEPSQQGRRLSGDYFSNLLGDRAPSPREASNGIYRVPSAGGLRRPPSPNLRIHYY